MSYTVTGNFLKETMDFFKSVPDIAAESASMALNQVSSRDGLAMMRHDIESQIAFPKGYLDQPDRLGVTQAASPARLEVIISARDRPTSLARFAPGQTPESTRKGGVRLTVKRGSNKHAEKAFLVRLNNGNIGLATRDKSMISRAYKPVMLGKGVYLLYAPSVDQVFKTVAADSLPQLGDMATQEFYRQFARLTNRR